MGKQLKAMAPWLLMVAGIAGLAWNNYQLRTAYRQVQGEYRYVWDAAARATAWESKRPMEHRSELARVVAATKEVE